MKDFIAHIREYSIENFIYSFSEISIEIYRNHLKNNNAEGALYKNDPVKDYVILNTAWICSCCSPERLVSLGGSEENFSVQGRVYPVLCVGLKCKVVGLCPTLRQGAHEVSPWIPPCLLQIFVTMFFRVYRH